MPAPPCMEASVPDDTAYDQLQLLCLRESGAATELLKGTRALNLRTPELSALAADMLEAQHDLRATRVVAAALAPREGVRLRRRGAKLSPSWRARAVVIASTFTPSTRR